MEVEIDASDVKKREADDRGRVRLGPEFADKEVDVAVVNVADERNIPRLSNVERYSEERDESLDDIVRISFDNGAFYQVRHIHARDVIRTECGRPQDNGSVYDGEGIEYTNADAGNGPFENAERFATIVMSMYLSCTTPEDVRDEFGTEGKVILGEL